MAGVILHDGIEFKQVQGHPSYAVSRCGLVLSTAGRTPRILKQGVSHKGYAKVGIGIGRRKTSQVHTLVLEAWVGPKPHARSCCCHIDGNQSNNTAGNLRWGSYEENAADRRKHNGGVYSDGYLPGEATDRVLEMLASGDVIRKITEETGVSRSHVYRIKRGEVERFAVE